MIFTKEEYNLINLNQYKKQRCWYCNKEFYYFPSNTLLTIHPIGGEIGFNVTCPYCNNRFFTK